MRSSHLTIVICVVCGLSACGGAPPGTSEFAQVSREGADLVEQFEDVELTQIMPVSGTASYVGTAAFAFERGSTSVGSADVAARLTLQADFASGSISGQFGDFIDTSDVRYSGVIDVRNGVMAGNEFEADVEGALMRPSGSSAVTGQMGGAFIGSGAEAIAGIVEATAFGSPFVGFFIGETQ